MWPVDGGDSAVGDQSDGSDGDGDVEAQIAREVAAIKRPKVEKRFGRVILWLSVCCAGLTVRA